EQQKTLVRAVISTGLSEQVRLAALDALAKIDAGKHAGTLGKVLAEPRNSFAVRERAANLLAGANQDATRDQLVAALPVAPARLQTSIAAGLALSREGSQKLLDVIAAGKASPRLLQEKAVVVRLDGHRLPGMKERVAKLTAGLPAADARLAQLIE